MADPPSNGPALIIVGGAPGTGKTTLARRLAASLRVPYLGKDLIKESLFDSLGTRDREWSRKLGLASIELQFKLIESHLEVGQSVVAESNFYVQYDVPRFQRLSQWCSSGIVEVHCETDREVLYDRLIRRNQSGRRHPGHYASGMWDELEPHLRSGTFGPLGLGGALVRVDTTDFERVDYGAVLSAVKAAVGL